MKVSTIMSWPSLLSSPLGNARSSYDPFLCNRSRHRYCVLDTPVATGAPRAFADSLRVFLFLVSRFHHSLGKPYRDSQPGHSCPFSWLSGVGDRLARRDRPGATEPHHRQLSPHRGIRILEMPQFPLDGRSRSHSDRNSNNHSDGCDGLAASSARLLAETASGCDAGLCARNSCLRLRHHSSIFDRRKPGLSVSFHGYRL